MNERVWQVDWNVVGLKMLGGGLGKAWHSVRCSAWWCCADVFDFFVARISSAGPKVVA